MLLLSLWKKIQPGMLSSYTFEIQPWEKAKKGHTQFADGDVAFAKISPCFENRKSMMISNLPNGVGGGTTELIILRSKDILQTYTFWLISTEDFIRGGASTYSGTVGQQRISMNYVKNYPVPLAPFAEQQRIVDRIESLFAKLDEAKGKAQEALESFETRRSSVLECAFSGKLTENWRREHKKESTWKCVRFDEAAHIRSNLVEPMEYRKLPHIAPDNIEKKTGRLLEYHTIEEDGVSSGKHHFYPGQILYSKIRPYLSKVVLVDFEGLCSADMYPIEAIGNTKLLWYQMLSDDFLEQASSAGSRSVLPKINQKELSALCVNVTDNKDEEKEIIRILDDFFAKEAEAKAKEEATLDAIEAMKKSILAKAFRGELGTNDPEDESAEELLKRTFA
ncbi:MAG: restriction endonuclease subunit S [Lachnospiraceae bacterium]|nr:restriction endonuclease subunit S [Lachnospiraceae bacterium]